MEMGDLRWILLGAAVVIIAVVYFFSRVRKKEQSYTPVEADSDVPSFSAQDNTVKNEWQDGVGPVRVVDAELAVDDMIVDDDETVENVIVGAVTDKQDEFASSVSKNKVHSENKNLSENNEKMESGSENNSDEAVDDVISVYVLAMDQDAINGEKILSASYALHLDYGEMKIFHRHEQDSARGIQFSMANVQAPGWFEIDNMNDMKTTGVSFFMQVNLVDNASAVLDEMLICAHGLSKMLGVTLCNAQRKPLDETSTIQLREKVKRLETIKARSV